jgi:hypothetical protein
LEPRRAQPRIDSALLAAIHNGGCGRCAGGGSTMIPSNRQYRPWCENGSLAVNALRSTASASSKRLSASLGGIAKPANSLLRYPLPMPKSNRPRDNRSSVAACSASSTGLCHGRTMTAVPSRSVVVFAAIQVSRFNVADTCPILVK